MSTESTDNKPGAEQQQTKEKSEAAQQNIDTATSNPAASVSQKPCEVRVNVPIDKKGKVLTDQVKIQNPGVITDCMETQGGKRRRKSRGRKGGRKSKRRSSKKARKSKKSKRRRGKKSKRRRRRK